MLPSSSGAGRRAASRGLLALSLVLGVLACALQGRRGVDVHQWWRGRGPVVPHDTFPADCTLCHTGGGWSTLRADFEFDHLARTGVALEGAHAKAECLRCHNDRGPVQVFAARGCAGCHEDAHRGRLGANCESCHGVVDWRPQGQIAMHQRTRFPLVGAHAATACWRCHPQSEAGEFTRTPIQCVACHQDDLARADEPDHLAQGWVDGCQRCHIPTTWTGGGFNHAAFPLTGKHAQIACEACHAGGVFAGTPDRCVDCHLADYQGAQNPNHVALNFPTACQQCHTTSSWQGANFNHAGITNGCVVCHLADYQGTTNPDHAAAGFPTSCETCHTTNAWKRANFQHQFPITSGKHAGFDCGDCHLAPGNFTSFSCTHCHEHSQREMDDEHEDVRGYVWQSQACYLCHPDGKE